MATKYVFDKISKFWTDLSICQLFYHITTKISYISLKWLMYKGLSLIPRKTKTWKEEVFWKHFEYIIYVHYGKSMTFKVSLKPVPFFPYFFIWFCDKNSRIFSYLIFWRKKLTFIKTIYCLTFLVKFFHSATASLYP